MHIAGMRHRRAFHLHRLCLKTLMDALAGLLVADELIPGGNYARMDP